MELALWSNRLVAALAKIPGLTDVSSDQAANGLQLKIDIDRDAASRLGILPAAIDSALYDAFGQRPAAKVFTTLNQYFVIVEVDPSFRRGPDAAAKRLSAIGPPARRSCSARSPMCGPSPHPSSSITRDSSPP